MCPPPPANSKTTQRIDKRKKATRIGQIKLDKTNHSFYQAMAVIYQIQRE